MVAKHFVLLAVVLVGVGCAGSAGEDTIGESNDALATAGQICAGGVKKATCGLGLKCVRNGHLGKCVNDPRAQKDGASEGDSCGGKIGCKKPLTCEKSTPSAATGTCEKVQAPPPEEEEEEETDEGADRGERCGTGIATTIKCKAGLTCSAGVGMGTCR